MTSEKTRGDSVRAEVRAHYSQIARQAERSCCGTSAEPTCCGAAAESTCCGQGNALPLYSSEELGAVPQAAAAASQGCGNPVAIASLKPGEVVLDLGSGGGIDCFLAAQRVGPEGHVYGLDMTDAMLALARRNAQRAGIKNVEFLKGDLEAIPLPDKTVDVIISNCVVNLTPDKAKALSEAFRVLKPGGRVAISDVVIDPDLSGLPVSEETVRASLSWAGCIAGALTSTQYRTLLAGAGFEDISVDVQRRSSMEILAGGVPEGLMDLPLRTVKSLVERFGSAYISARRPS